MREVFAVDVTVARGRCASAAVRACGRGAGLRPRARAGGPLPRLREVLMRVVRGPDRVWLDLRGVTVLEIPLAHHGVSTTRPRGRPSVR